MVAIVAFVNLLLVLDAGETLLSHAPWSRWGAHVRIRPNAPIYTFSKLVKLGLHLYKPLPCTGRCASQCIFRSIRLFSIHILSVHDPHGHLVSMLLAVYLQRDSGSRPTLCWMISRKEFSCMYRPPSTFGSDIVFCDNLCNIYNWSMRWREKP